ncbi:MAG: nucleotidyltransferase domain-containing protein [Nanoarchaeota archaeon]
MRSKIIKSIKEAEKKHNVNILWAIESGSRAWGFASEDSDYDIRCMHIGKTDSYLGLFQPPLQINYLEGKIDLESWDIKKFAQLTLKSNPQIAEWLRSPIVYIDSPIRLKFRRYFDQGCSLEFLRQHYISMARQNYHKYMGIGVSHSCKKYLYVLRGIACANYIEKEKKLPPLPYKDAIPYLPKYTQDFFERCVIQKNTTEKAEILSDERVSNFIDSSLSQSSGKVNAKFKKAKGLNKYLIKIIKKNKL